MYQIIPPVPPEGSGRRQRALTVEEYEREFRAKASDLELAERVFRSGMFDNQLRAALWPYLFGLVKQRGGFLRLGGDSPDTYTSSTSTSGSTSDDSGSAPAHDRPQRPASYVYVEHEDNVKRWRELERLYLAYQSQWKSILPDQELRFSTFRERKSLIERDVVRSDRSHPFYADNSQNLAALSQLLLTYMMYDFDIGYLQGMSDLAAPILYMFEGDLVKSFWVFVEVMKLCRRNFEYSQKTIHFQLNCLYRLTKITDPKFAKYLSENDCSNCFFAFRCIVCQFKRELMRSRKGESEDYGKVLSLWDSIWVVQRRHELLARSKYVHTFTIANGRSQRCRSGCGRRGGARGQRAGSSPSANGLANGLASGLANGLANGRPNGYHSNGHSPATRTSNGHPRASPRPSPITSNAGRRRWPSSAGGSPLSSLSCSPSDSCRPAAPVKQEQVVYTKETFYSSFDPNQADVPRFELSETEKFVLALCMSLIRRERSQILSHQLDASGIHQQFINPHLANDLDNFLEDAYQIYDYLNTDCDLQQLVRGASELSGPSEELSGADGPLGPAASPRDDTADTYKLLEDYFVIEPTSRCKYSVSQQSWDNALNNNHNHSIHQQHQCSHHHLDACSESFA